MCQTLVQGVLFRPPGLPAPSPSYKMTNPSPQPDQRERAPQVPRRQQRQVSLPGARPTQRRGGLLLVGLVLVFGSGLGFWLVLQSIDQRAGYLVAARTIERWEVAGPGDFIVVEANVGDASALAADQVAAVAGRWATGRIPAGTLITAGLFETPPLSSESEADKVWMRVTLPPGDIPSGSFSSGDTIALIGRESSGPDGGQGDLSLIGVIQLEVVQGDELHYIVTPQEALEIQRMVDRYNLASDSFIWPLGFDLGAEDLLHALQQAATVPAVTTGTLLDGVEQGSGAEPVEGQ